jgi:hypothetical protein
MVNATRDKPTQEVWRAEMKIGLPAQRASGPTAAPAQEIDAISFATGHRLRRWVVACRPEDLYCARRPEPPSRRPARSWTSVDRDSDKYSTGDTRAAASMAARL